MERCIENAESHCKSYPRCYGCGAFRNPTNADRIRVMSDEELAEFISNCGCLDHARDCRESCTDCALEWLKQPAEE